MSVVQPKNTPLSPEMVQRRFNSLSEKRKRELGRVVAGMIQIQGKVAAQRWLAQRLSEPSAEVDQKARWLEGGLKGNIDYGELTDDVAALTPSREKLVATAPMTVTDLSLAAKTYKNAVLKAEPFTQEQMKLIASELTPQSRTVMTFLHLYAVTHALSREQSLKAQQISFFLPAETIHLVTKVPKRTVYDALKRLRALNLVDQRGHVTTLPDYGNRYDGTIFAVKLNVLEEGKARVAFADLEVDDYRDLAADIGAGRTVYQPAHSTWVGDLRFSICVLLRWVESRCTEVWNTELIDPRFMNVQASKHGLETLLDVTVGKRVNRGQRIGVAAAAIGRAFGDQHSLAFWWKFCDALAGLTEGGGRDYAPTIIAAIQREVAAKQEGFALNAAALFIARLKKSGIYGEIMAA